MSEEKKPAEEGAEGAAPKSKKKLFIIIGGVVVLLAGAGIPLMMMGGGEKPAEGEAEAHEEVRHYETILLDTFIVNLSANSAFLKVGIMLEIDPAILAKADAHAAGGAGHGGGGSGGASAEAAGGLSGVLKTREPMIRDAVIRVLSSKKAEEVLTIDGKERLKEELIETINEATGLDEGPVVNIYFTEFMVQ